MEVEETAFLISQYQLSADIEASRRDSIASHDDECHKAKDSLISPLSQRPLEPLPELEDPFKKQILSLDDIENKVTKLEAENRRLKEYNQDLEFKINQQDITAKQIESRLTAECDRLKMDGDRLRSMVERYREVLDERKGRGSEMVVCARHRRNASSGSDIQLKSGANSMPTGAEDQKEIVDIAGEIINFAGEDFDQKRLKEENATLIKSQLELIALYNAAKDRIIRLQLQLNTKRRSSIGVLQQTGNTLSELLTLKHECKKLKKREHEMVEESNELTQTILELRKEIEKYRENDCIRLITTNANFVVQDNEESGAVARPQCTNGSEERHADHCCSLFSWLRPRPVSKRSSYTHYVSVSPSKRFIDVSAG